jgi:hypothetical protein
MTLKTKEYGLMKNILQTLLEILHPLLSVLQTKQRLMKVKKNSAYLANNIPGTVYLSNYDEQY